MELFSKIPQQYFVSDLKKNTLGSLKIAVLREVTGNMIIRSNYADETISFKLNEQKDLVEIPARKLKSKEKLLGLKICRQFGVVSDELRYNVIKKSAHLANPNSILFGDSVTESNDAVGISSRAIYDWAYSIRDMSDITATYQHNALSEGGTMFDEEKGELRRSLFQVQYIKPNTYFPHFITVENVTPELLFHLLTCVKEESRYGAQSTTLGANVKNHILGIGYARFEQPVNSFSIAKDWNSEKDVNLANVKEVILKSMKAAYGEQFIQGEQVVKILEEVWKNEENLKTIYSKSQQDCEQFLRSIKVIK